MGFPNDEVLVFGRPHGAGPPLLAVHEALLDELYREFGAPLPDLAGSLGPQRGHFQVAEGQPPQALPPWIASTAVIAPSG